jgi:selenocysteine lyase/cysteine desulfurase
LLAGLNDLEDVTIWGISDANRMAERVPTVSITHRTTPAPALAGRLGDRGIYVWDGNYYAVEVTDALGLDPDGMVRIGLLHYNTPAEVDRLLDELAQNK